MAGMNLPKFLGNIGDFKIGNWDVIECSSVLSQYLLDYNNLIDFLCPRMLKAKSNVRKLFNGVLKVLQRTYFLG